MIQNCKAFEEKKLKNNCFQIFSMIFFQTFSQLNKTVDRSLLFAKVNIKISYNILKTIEAYF